LVDKDRLKWFAVCLAVIYLFGFAVYAVYVFFVWSNNPKKPYSETAPNGVYRVFLVEVESSQQVRFTVDESSGSELLGTWKVAEDLHFPAEEMWYRVRLADNVVVEASMLGHMGEF